MPKAANPFDYRTIADVLLTIEYTALEQLRLPPAGDPDARPPTLSADRPFSFRHQFADAWYDLHNPDQTADADDRAVHHDARRLPAQPRRPAHPARRALLRPQRAATGFEVPVTAAAVHEQGDTGRSAAPRPRSMASSAPAGATPEAGCR